MNRRGHHGHVHLATSGVDVRVPGPAASRGEGAAWETAQLSLLSHEVCTIQRECTPSLLRLSTAPNICENLQIPLNTRCFSISAVRELAEARADHLLPLPMDSVSWIIYGKWEPGIQLCQSHLCWHCVSGSLPGAWESPKGLK